MLKLIIMNNLGCDNDINLHDDFQYFLATLALLLQYANIEHQTSFLIK